MTAKQTPTAANPDGQRAHRSAVTLSDGAAIHPRFLRVGPWVLSLVAAALFVLSFSTSYAALYDYALQLEFGPEYAVVFPLVLDAVISVLAVTVLLERALRRRTLTIKGWRVALWIYFGGSVAGNVAHAPATLPAQLVAAVPPISAALTFHLLLRLLDRAPALREIAECYEERAVEEQERRARRTQLKARSMVENASPSPSAHGRGANVSSDSDDGPRSTKRRDGRRSRNGHGATRAATSSARTKNGHMSSADVEDLRTRVQDAMASGDRVTGDVVGQWLGVSARTGRRRFAVEDVPSLDEVFPRARAAADWRRYTTAAAPRAVDLSG